MVDRTGKLRCIKLLFPSGRTGLMSTLNIPFVDELAALRRDIHAHPELAFAELRTADLVARELERYGLEVDRGLAGTGVVGVLRKGSSGRGIGLRADMDALPLYEKNDFPHRSRNPGKMHACGHDGHTAILLGAARYMAAQQHELAIDGSVYFIFQPAEESEGGAAVMISDGLFDRFPMAAVFGLHNWPGLPVGQMAVMPGPVMAGTCAFEITVRGHGCHAAMPQQGVDTLVVTSQLVLALQTVVARNVHPCESAVVSVTQIHAGEAWNIIPDDAVLRGTIRSFKAEIQELVERSVERLCSGIASAFGAQISVRFDHRYPPTVNSPAESEVCRRVATRLLGAENVRTSELPSMGAEDFAYMLGEKPGCYVWLGNGPGTGGCTLHNPHYDFNDEILPLGVSYWVQLAESVLAEAPVA
ncbi:MAG: putative hydrolase YxeP [Candidatus Accumulibacter sp. SK-11]|nr:MAG: putative hydrolase YxeP [Candidatus Accumulibacter sp. SK-11]